MLKVLKTWMIVSLYSDDKKVRFNELIKKQVQNNLIIVKLDSINKSKTSMKDCRWLVVYFAKIYVLQHTDLTRTKNKIIVYSNTILKENNNLIIKNDVKWTI